MYIAINDENFRVWVFFLDFTSRHDNIIEHTKSLASIGESMMCASSEIDSQPILEGGLGGVHRAA